MGKNAEYRLRLRNLPVGIQQFAYTVDSDFFKEMESADIHAGNVDVQVSVNNDGRAFDLEFTLKGKITISCDRCLDDMEHDVDTRYGVSVRYGDDFNFDDEVIVIPESESDIDLAPIIYDTIALTIPLKHVHADGQCNPEMAECLSRHEAHLADEISEATSPDPRWDALRNLLDNK